MTTPQQFKTALYNKLYKQYSGAQQKQLLAEFKKQTGLNLETQLTRRDFESELDKIHGGKGLGTLAGISDAVGSPQSSRLQSAGGSVIQKLQQAQKQLAEEESKSGHQTTGIGKQSKQLQRAGAGIFEKTPPSRENPQRPQQRRTDLYSYPPPRAHQPPQLYRLSMDPDPTVFQSAFQEEQSSRRSGLPPSDMPFSRQLSHQINKIPSGTSYSGMSYVQHLSEVSEHWDRSRVGYIIGQANELSHSQIFPMTTRLLSQNGVRDQVIVESFHEELVRNARIAEVHSNPKLSAVGEQLLTRLSRSWYEEAHGEESKHELQPFSNLSQNSGMRERPINDLAGQLTTENQQPSQGFENNLVVNNVNVWHPNARGPLLPADQVFGGNPNQGAINASQLYNEYARAQNDREAQEWDLFTQEFNQEVNRAMRSADEARQRLAAQRFAPNQDGNDPNIDSLATTTQRVTLGEENLGLSQVLAAPDYQSFINDLENQNDLNEEQRQLFESIVTDETILAQNLSDYLNEEGMEPSQVDSRSAESISEQPSNSSYPSSQSQQSSIAGGLGNHRVQIGTQYVTIADIYKAITKMGETVSKISGNIESMRLKDYKTQTSVFKQKIVTKKEPTDFQISAGALFKLRKCC